MKKIILLTALITIQAVIFSCKVIAPYAIKGNYAEGPVKVTVKTEYPEVFDKVLKALSVAGINGLKIVNREDGVIVSEDIDFSGKYTRENEDGRVSDERAQVVIGDFHLINDKKIEPNLIKGTLNIWIRDNGNNREISILLSNLKCSYVYQKGTEIEQETEIPVKSTGVLEKIITGNLN